MSRAQRVDLEALERLDKEAARAPWVHGGSLVRDCDSRIIGEFENYVGTAFVVHMRNRLGAIIAELKAGRALRLSLKRYDDAVNSISDSVRCRGWINDRPDELDAPMVAIYEAEQNYDEATKGEG